MDILPIGVKLNAMLHPIKVLDAQTEKNSRSGIFSIRCKLSLDSKTERLMPLSSACAYLSSVSVAAMTAFIVCMRFSASAKTTD